MTVQADAGTGIETVGQADATNAAPQDAQQQVRQAESQQQGAEQAPDPLKAIMPQSPEEAAKLGEQREGGEDAAQQKQTEEAEPLKIEMPEGFQQDEAVMKGFLDLAKENGIKQEAAQKLFDMYAGEQTKLVSSIREGQMKYAAQINAEMAGRCRNDPEFGGEKFEESCTHAMAGIRRILPPAEVGEFLEYIRDSNQSNAYPIWKFLVRAGKATAEAAPVSGAGIPPETEKSLADRMFPDFPSAKQ